VPDFSLSLLVAIASALVGLLCLWLALVALRRARSTAPRLEGSETPAELYNFAAKQMFSAAVMFVLAVIIYIYS